MLFHLQTLFLVPGYNPIRCIPWSKWRWLWQFYIQGQMDPILDTILPTDFMLCTKLQFKKMGSMTQVTLTEGRVHRSRSNYQQNEWNYKNWTLDYIGNAISPIYFYLEQPKKVHSITKVMMTLSVKVKI